MALFSNASPKNHKRRNSKKPRLDVLCHHMAKHPLPVKMKPIGQSTSHSGEAMTVFACPFDGCDWREGWVMRRGRPTRLWAGKHRRNRRRRSF